MSFLRRVLGGGSGRKAGTPDKAAEFDAAPEIDDAERDRQLAREEAERTSDELISRQLRYADRAWTPPAQGGTRRADDAEGGDTP